MLNAASLYNPNKVSHQLFKNYPIYKTLSTSIIYNPNVTSLPDYESIAKICNQEEREHIKWFQSNSGTLKLQYEKIINCTKISCYL